MNIYILKQLSRAGFTHEQIRRMSKADRALAITMAAANDMWEQQAWEQRAESYI